jgi:hypothetical protein
VLPSNFKILAEYFIVPLLVLLISYAISGQFNLRYSAGTDFFIFFLSADVGARRGSRGQGSSYQQRHPAEQQGIENKVDRVRHQGYLRSHGENRQVEKYSEQHHYHTDPGGGGSWPFC